jgi:hypothetical protein
MPIFTQDDDGLKKYTSYKNSKFEQNSKII